MQTPWLTRRGNASKSFSLFCIFGVQYIKWAEVWQLFLYLGTPYYQGTNCSPYLFYHQVQCSGENIGWSSLLPGRGGGWCGGEKNEKVNLVIKIWKLEFKIGNLVFDIWKVTLKFEIKIFQIGTRATWGWKFEIQANFDSDLL